MTWTWRNCFRPKWVFNKARFLGVTMVTTCLHIGQINLHKSAYARDELNLRGYDIDMVTEPDKRISAFHKVGSKVVVVVVVCLPARGLHKQDPPGPTIRQGIQVSGVSSTITQLLCPRGLAADQ